jgi:hypothetical protein
VSARANVYETSSQLPPVECLPELWVVDDEKFRRAESVLKKTLAPLHAVKKSWACAGCGETIEGQFSECWSCGRDRFGRKAQRSVKPISAAARRR